MNRKCITLFALFNGTPNASIITCVRALFHSIRVRFFFLSRSVRSFVRRCVFFSLLFLSCMFILSFENYTVESTFGSIYENEYAHRKLCRGGNFYLKQKFYIRVSHFAVAGFFLFLSFPTIFVCVFLLYICTFRTWTNICVLVVHFYGLAMSTFHLYFSVHALF